MNDFLTRSFSGLVYAFLIIFSLIISDFFFSTIILIFTLLALVEFQRIIKFKNPIPYIFLISIFIYLLSNNYKTNISALILVFSLLTNIYLTYDLFYNKINTAFNLEKLFLPIFYISGSSCFIILTQKVFPEFLYWVTFYFFTIIWINNSFAYIIGKNFGKNLLFKKISPKKTWEGFLGGLVFTVFVAIIFCLYKSSFSLFFYIFIGILIAVLSTIGDLIQSKFKRQANVKDSGSLIPGHGGFFDRMDSVIFSSPWFFFITNINQYVS